MQTHYPDMATSMFGIQADTLSRHDDLDDKDTATSTFATRSI
jgi:hypothetical protein